MPLELHERFHEYDWPGNVRELCNELRRWLATGDVELSGPSPEQLSPIETSMLSFDNLQYAAAVAAFEAQFLARTLKQFNGNRTRAAEALGLDRRTLQRKLKKSEKK